MDFDFARYLRDPDPWRAPTPLPADLETDSLIVRLWRPGDGPALFEAVDADRSALLPWMVWALKDHRTVEESIYYVQSQVRQAASPGCTHYDFGIFDRASGRCLGGGGFARIQPNLREAEIGYWIRGNAHGRGHCTEAIGALITRGFETTEQGGWGFRRIVIHCLSNNVGSRRVCEKLGLRLEVQAKEARYLADDTGGRYYDLLGFAVLASEWDCERGCRRA